MSDWRSLFEDGLMRTLDGGDVLFHREDPVIAAYLIVSGCVAMERGLATGDALVLCKLRSGQLVAGASLFADRYHCDAVMREKTQVLVLEKPVLLRRLGSAPTATLSLLADASREVQQLRNRVEILRFKRVADRLSAWLDINGAPQKGGWVGVAEEIGVSPEALYRELARRKT